MQIKILTTGGTIDKIYFDKMSEFQVGEPQIGEVLRESNVSFDYEIVPLMAKDSLDLTDEDRQLIYDTIAQDSCRRFIITHGTDTMTTTGRKLQSIADKLIVLVGSLAPAQFRTSDAIFNIGCAVMAAQTLPYGVYLTMNGSFFEPDRAEKNREKLRFEKVRRKKG